MLQPRLCCCEALFRIMPKEGLTGILAVCWQMLIGHNFLSALLVLLRLLRLLWLVLWLLLMLL